jgi:paraquat-inducible protein A
VARRGDPFVHPREFGPCYVRERNRWRRRKHYHRGILEFWRSGSLGIALLIFVASVAVPITKFVALGLLTAMALRKEGGARAQRSRLYRFVEFIGYWSMLDVIVVALTCRLVHFEGLAIAEPRMGIVFFYAVVLVTMMLALSFDQRAIWVRQIQS